jgi:protein lysine acetyltransferase
MQRTQGLPAERKLRRGLERLPDGTQILIRQIRADDKRLLEAGLRCLSEESVYRRFLSPKHRFSRAELRYLTEVDGRNHVALVAEYPGPVRRLIAVGRYVRWPDDPGAAEVAVTVCDDWQRRGVGSLFARRLATHARLSGVRKFTATMSSENVAAHKLMHKLAFHLREQHAAGGVSELVGDLAA